MNRPTALLPRLMLVPLLGATESLVSALGLWLMFVTVINLFGLALSSVRLRLTAAAQMPASILLAAALTSCAELTAQAWALQWQQYVGLYGALIALVCVVLEHTGHFYSA